jgi:hypothetical protein
MWQLWQIKRIEHAIVPATGDRQGEQQGKDRQ